jgi:hypothetical protein
MDAVETNQTPPYASVIGERHSLLELQRRHARFMAEANQIVLHAMGVLARQQADALHTMLDELARAPAAPSGAANGHAFGDVQQRYLCVSVQAFVAQMKLGLESAAAINSAALSLVQERMLAAAAGGGGQPAER